MSEALIENEIAGGVVHELTADLKKAPISDAKALETWQDITPLARNEWIAGLSRQKKQKPELAESNGAVPASKKESGDLVVGLAVRIVEIIVIRRTLQPFSRSLDKGRPAGVR
jgi:hypothetical protein